MPCWTNTRKPATHTTSGRHTDTRVCTPAAHKLERQSKTGHRFGAHYEYQDSQIFNSQAVSGCCQSIKSHTLTHSSATAHTCCFTGIRSLDPETYLDIGDVRSLSNDGGILSFSGFFSPCGCVRIRSDSLIQERPFAETFLRCLVSRVTTVKTILETGYH